MAAGAGLLLLAVTVTGLHFIIIFGFSPLARRLTNWLEAARFTSCSCHRTKIERGVLRQRLSACVAQLAGHLGGNGVGIRRLTGGAAARVRDVAVA